MKHIFKGFVGKRDLWKRVPTSGGFTTIDDGREVADLEVTVDVDQLIRNLGVRAMTNKKREARAQHGAIIVRARHLRRTP